ncbi:phosphoenolpyruvate-dihydroxyacetone phosphotransferase, ADP-binding subunit DhaL [Halarchaeum acidiphilum MH1-52-1]|uniref:Phosphoenolpyruvate-dihydroxyacetone phosphotransferase, ADP-binding subunit DhaL n=1 Tax=Halarchaeum acidiphilum MH1-52-1 TaxID=1261545 RepID=U2YR05_9EURY|nr:dihydroxyacetone kinase subunit DhaL [Halarchaeum acidiphilum]GAD51400.1 phosphoenolpyruvate-dihydroxyacetone phosphotransferase, ADP-binding subunit DhaL [Halarchaeum acidiphilum MH1-52-1]
MSGHGDTEALLDALARIDERIHEERAYLTELDSRIGDADHGNNLARGVGAVTDKRDELAGMALDEAVKTVGTTLISEVGGAAGPLYGGSVMAASRELEGGLDAESALAFARAYREKLMERGDARPGDKTMVDAVVPAVHTFQRAIEEDDLPPVDALAKAVDAARRGVEYTVPLRASKGRASYLGLRAVGHRDPGATSTLFVLEELLATAEDRAGAASVRDARADDAVEHGADAERAAGEEDE